MFHKLQLHYNQAFGIIWLIQHSSKKVCLKLWPCFLQVSMTVRASSTANSAFWLCLLLAVKAAANLFWKTTSQLSTLFGIHSALSVGWVFLCRLCPKVMSVMLAEICLVCAVGLKLKWKRLIPCFSWLNSSDKLILPTQSHAPDFPNVGK